MTTLNSTLSLDQGKNCESPFSFFNFIFNAPNSEYNHAASTVNNKVMISANERAFEPHILKNNIDCSSRKKCSVTTHIILTQES